MCSAEHITKNTVSLCLGSPPVETIDEQEELPIMKRKPGRPPGRRNVPNSPLTLAGTSSRKRKVSTKSPVCRRRLIAETDAENAPKRLRNKPSASRGSLGNSERTHSSDNAPLRNMVPKATRKRVDFRDPAPPLP